MARTLGVSTQPAFIQRQAKDYLRQLSSMRKEVGGGRSDITQPLKDVSEVLKRWNDTTKKLTTDETQLSYIFKKIFTDTSDLDNVIKDGTKKLSDMFKNLVGNSGLSKLVPTEGSGAGGVEGGAIAGAAASGGIGRSLLIGGVGLALGAGATAFGLTYSLATAEQGVEQQSAYRGVRIGSPNQFFGLRNRIAGAGLMSSDEAGQFALGIGGISGRGNSFSNFSQYTQGAARFTRELGLTNEQGTDIAGQFRRIGGDRKELEEFGNIIGKAAAEAGMGGREAETMKALTDNLSTITNFIMTSNSAGGPAVTYAARMIGAMQDRFKNIPGMQGAAGVQTFTNAMNALQGNNVFTSQLGNMSAPMLSMGLLQAGGGDIGKAMNIGMRANIGDKASWDAISSTIKSIQDLLGGGKVKADSLQGDIQSYIGMQIFGKYLSPEQLGGISTEIDKMRKGGAKEEDINKALEKDWGVKAKEDMATALKESLTGPINQLTKTTAEIGKAGFPTLATSIDIMNKVGMWWEKTGEPSLDKFSKALDNFVGDVSKKGIVRTTIDDAKGFWGDVESKFEAIEKGGLSGSGPGIHLRKPASVTPSAWATKGDEMIRSFFSDLVALATAYATSTNTSLSTNPDSTVAPTGKVLAHPKAK